MIHGRSEFLEKGCKGPRTAKSVQILKRESRDPRIADLVRFLRREFRDPRTAESVRILEKNFIILEPVKTVKTTDDLKHERISRKRSYKPVDELVRPGKKSKVPDSDLTDKQLISRN